MWGAGGGDDGGGGGWLYSVYCKSGHRVGEVNHPATISCRLYVT